MKLRLSDVRLSEFHTMSRQGKFFGGKYLVKDVAGKNWWNFGRIFGGGNLRYIAISIVDMYVSQRSEEGGCW